MPGSVTTKPIHLAVKLGTHPEALPPLTLYVFDPQWKLEKTIPLTNGEIELGLPEARVKEARLLVAPPLPAGVTPTIEMVTKLHPFEVEPKIDPNTLGIHVHLPPDLVTLVKLCTHVTGSVSVRVQMPGPIGRIFSLPVSNALVKVYVGEQPGHLVILDETDQHGRFQGDYWHYLPVNPTGYVVVEYLIAGAWVPIHQTPQLDLSQPINIELP